MKTNRNFKLEFLGLLFATLGLFTLPACNNASEKEDSKEVAEDHNEAKFNNDGKEKDSQFLVNAAEMGMIEVQLGKLAQSNGKMNDVKDLGKMMEDDHSKALADLRGLAAKKQVSLPASVTEDGQEKYKSLMERKGVEFDKAYCDEMVSAHKDAISKFEIAASESQDSEIKAWANSTLPTLRAHLDHAMVCQKKCESMTSK